MSLISKVAAIATAGAAGGETFWASSVRVTTTTVENSSSAYLTHGEHESDGTIMQFFHTNAGMPVENRFQAFLVARDPVDGSIQTQKKTNDQDEDHKLSQNSGAPFYNPSIGTMFLGVQSWYDPTGNGSNRNGYLPVDTDCTYGETIAYGDDNTSNGNGDFIISYRGDKLVTFEYDLSTDTVPFPAGRERKTNNVSGVGIWTERGSSDIYLTGYISGGNRLMKSTVGVTSLPDFSYVRELPTGTTAELRNKYSNFEQCTDSTSMYIWSRNNQQKIEFYQVPKSNLSTWKRLLWPVPSGLSAQHRSYCSICCADGFVYFSSPIIYRGTGESYNSVMYAIYQINPSTFAPVAAIGVRCNGGALEKYDSNPGTITRNAEETCLYLSFIHSHEARQGGESHKLLKLPLDLSSLPAQNISGGSTHGTIQIWDFLSTSTGSTLPVESEIFGSAPASSSGNMYTRTVEYESIQNSNSPQEANVSPVSASLISDLDPITGS